MRGPMLVIANHTSNVDPLLVALAVPRRVYFLAKEEVFQMTFVGWLSRIFRVIPMSRGKTDYRALKLSMETLRQGRVLCLYPEGTRSKTGKLRQAMPGAVSMAIKAGVPILPVGITGGWEALRVRPIPLLRRRISVTIGDPYFPAAPNRKLDHEAAQALTDEMMRRLAELLPKDKRGYYAEEE